MTRSYRNPVLLYSELDGADSSQIAARLEQMNLPYRLSPDGSQVFVPSDRVGSLRLAMAAEGIPSGGSVGYEIFDRSEGLGTTNFVQGINHLRALEGELARTISSIGRVKQAHEVARPTDRADRIPAADQLAEHGQIRRHPDQ